jgi:hypothetical protein
MFLLKLLKTDFYKEAPVNDLLYNQKLDPDPDLLLKVPNLDLDQQNCHKVEKNTTL